MFNIKNFLIENKITTTSRIDEKLNFSGGSSNIKGLKTKLSGDKVESVDIIISPTAKKGMSLSMGGTTVRVTPEQAMKILDFLEMM